MASPPSAGTIASLAPKPWPDLAGNGGHIHFSLWDADRDATGFHDGTAATGSRRGAARSSRGVLDHLPGLLRTDGPELSTPTSGSCRRLGRRVHLLGP